MRPFGRTKRRQKVLIGFVRYRHLCEQIRGLQNLESPCKGDVFTFFSLLRKEPKVAQRVAPLWTPGTLQIAGRNGVLDRMTGFRQVTGYAKVAILHRIDGNDLNRCELQALHKRICGFVQIHSGFFGKQ